MISAIQNPRPRHRGLSRQVQGQPGEEGAAGPNAQKILAMAYLTSCGLNVAEVARLRCFRKTLLLKPDDFNDNKLPLNGFPKTGTPSLLVAVDGDDRAESFVFKEQFRREAPEGFQEPARRGFLVRSGGLFWLFVRAEDAVLTRLSIL